MENERMNLLSGETETKAGNTEFTNGFCTECGISPPLRAHHCRHCGKCVAKFDHHCFLLGTCIGERNHCRFWWYLLFQSAELAFSIMVSATIRIMGTSERRIAGHGLPPVAFLALTSMTTHEVGHDPEYFPYLQGFQECDLPFSRGVAANLVQFCSPPRRQTAWAPTMWPRPLPFDRNSDFTCSTLWENKYYSCC
ncbi:TPA: hypothetical protein N0F65_008080 [Lagenidium giganteum]|uniref:Palmitoyltransferase n=1 Tax=Lagenidium giganteum TaxID=4803 RepID=A0AAV2YTG9_9STRA|nr:TPA: hypothetical protein N0F65_008080 [Lagenidium giganteum]